MMAPDGWEAREAAAVRSLTDSLVSGFVALSPSARARLVDTINDTLDRNVLVYDGTVPRRGTVPESPNLVS